MKLKTILLLLLIVEFTACAPKVTCPAYSVEKPLDTKEISG